MHKEMSEHPDDESGIEALRPLHIAFVTETYPPEVNGVAMTVESMVSRLRRRGHFVQVVRPRQAADARAQSRHESDDVLMGSLPLPRSPGLRMGTFSAGTLCELWTGTRPDIVHIATEGPLGWSALSVARKLGLPVTSDFRTNFHTYSRHYGLGWMQGAIMAYLRLFHNRTLCTMVPTEELRHDLAYSGFERLAVVARGVDTHRFDPRHRSAHLRAQWQARDDDLVVLCVGRLAPEKNLDLLLEAYRAIRGSDAQARLVIVGDGSMRQHLRANCPDAVLAGQRVGDDLAMHYASADLFLFPSLSETFGNVTAEAMASGLPVVAFDYAGAARLIRSGETGVLARFDDAPAFIDRAVALALDPGGRQAMGKRARTAASKTGWDDVVASFESILRATAQASGSRTSDDPSSDAPHRAPVNQARRAA